MDKTLELMNILCECNHYQRKINHRKSRHSFNVTLTLWVGTDDEDTMTTLAGVNLYPNVFQHIATIKNLRGHPYEFYQKCGFVIVGVMPDANGLGKPDIYMAKSLITGSV